MPGGLTPTEFTLLTEVTNNTDPRDEVTGLYDGPYYPKVTAGLLTLDTVDQGNRFLVSGNTWVIDDGVAGTHLAWVRKVSFRSQIAGGFALFPE